MQSGNKLPIDIIVNDIKELAGDNEKPLKELGIRKDIIHNIRNILHKYSYTLSQFFIEVIARTLQTHAPEKGFLRIEQFLNTSSQKLNLKSYPHELPYILSVLFSTSGALSSRLSSDSTSVNYLAELKKPLQPYLDKDYYLNSINTYCNDSESLSERIKTVHRMHTVQLIRICARNANPETSIAEITAELSSLAEAIIESCLNIALEETISKFGNGYRSHVLFILGLGKLGGRELNVSSDVDIMYLCDEEDSWDSFDNIRFYTTLAERVTQLLTEATESGYLYRVDTRLRADGISGPLVRTTADYIRYLEMRGKAWERQMLLKSRPVAGNIKSGQAFLNSIERFIFHTSITRSPHREIAAIKNQIEARILTDGSKKTHLKLMPGGIRDIEFIVQCLQLLTGGIHPEVRCTGSLPALVHLKDIDALNSDEYKTLSSAYILYRRVENALQWRELLPAFNLPDSPEELNELVSYLDFPDLIKEIERMMKKVRNIYNEIFNAENIESFEEMALRSAVNPSGDEKVKRFLENLGFKNPYQSAKDLSMLVFGKIETTSGLSIHPSIERFLPKLLKTLSELSDPGETLEHFKLIAESYNARSMLFDIMEKNPMFFDLLISITHGSVFITEILIKDPSFLDWLVEAGEILYMINEKGLLKELQHIDSEHSDDSSFTRECLRVKLREKLRIGTRDISGLSSTEQTLSELTTVAECIVKTVFQRAFRETTTKIPSLRHNYSFSIIAAGKLGCEMMDFGSDLDLIFVYKSTKENKKDIKIPEYSIKLAQKILSLISGGGGADKIFDVDARLRPEGGNSPLAISIDEYKKYFNRRASVWERLALVRAKYLAGTDNVKDEVTEVIHNFVYRKPFTHSEVKKIIKIRKTIAENSIKRYPGLINIKSGHGGISDIDFIAQSYAAHFGADKPHLRYRDTASILNALGSENILSRYDVSSIKELYSFLCNVEKSIRIGSGKSVNTLPKSGTELARVARLMGYKNIRRFNKRLEDVITLTKEFYDRLMQELLDSVTDVKK